MTVYVVGAVQIHDPDGYGKYAAIAGQAVQEFIDAGHTVESLSVDGNPKVYEGVKPADHLVVTKFDSKEDYEAFVASPRYQEALPHRLAASTTRFMMAMEAM